MNALEKFEDGAVSRQSLLARASSASAEYGVKILGNGKVTKKVTVRGRCFLRFCQGSYRGSRREGGGDQC